MDKNTLNLIIKIGFIIMAFQEVFILIFPYILPELTIPVFFLDIIGFFLIGIGFILLNNSLTEKKPQLLKAGVSFLLWDVCTVIWRIFTGFYTITHTTSDITLTIESFFTKIVSEKILFSIAGILGSILLFLGTYYYYKVQPGNGTGMLLIFSMANLIAMLFIGYAVLVTPETQLTTATNLNLEVFFSMIIKVLLVPLVGFFAFLFLLTKDDGVKKLQKLN